MQYAFVGELYEKCCYSETTYQVCDCEGDGPKRGIIWSYTQNRKICGSGSMHCFSNHRSTTSEKQDVAIDTRSLSIGQKGHKGDLRMANSAVLKSSAIALLHFY